VLIFVVIIHRVACWLGWHRYRVLARSDRHDRLKHLHPLAGCLARCEDCGWWWDDLPGANQRIPPWDSSTREE
jgi:hypothetical protein